MMSEDKRDALSQQRAMTLAKAVAELLAEMSGAQRLKNVLYLVHDVLIAVNYASPGHVNLLVTRLREMTDWPGESVWRNG